MLRIIITGPPGSGKTSLINSLASKGYPVIQEAAREIIKQQLKIPGSSAFPWANVKAFSALVKQHILDFPENHKTAFCDRSIVDIISYLKKAGITDYQDYITDLKKLNWHPEVIMCPPWQEIYQTDNERKEPFSEVELLYNILTETYKELGFTINELPKDTVDNRTEWIINRFGHLFG